MGPASYPSKLHRDQLEAFRLETLDDLADESALDAIGLDHDEGALLVSRHFASRSVIARRNSNWE